MVARYGGRLSSKSSELTRESVDLCMNVLACISLDLLPCCLDLPRLLALSRIPGTALLR